MSDWTCPPDRFPIMGPGPTRYGERRLTVPFAFVKAHERQANTNHGQTVERLKERGGLGWSELAAVVEGRDWRQMDVDAAHEQTMRVLLAWHPKPTEEGEKR